MCHSFALEPQAKALTSIVNKLTESKMLELLQPHIPEVIMFVFSLLLTALNVQSFKISPFHSFSLQLYCYYGSFSCCFLISKSISPITWTLRFLLVPFMVSAHKIKIMQNNKVSKILFSLLLSERQLANLMIIKSGKL